MSHEAHIKPSQSTQQLFTDGMRIVFKGLTHTVESTAEKGLTLSLLKNVSGYLEPSQMTALMGPSGSGKTTLLDVLSGRKNTGKTEGTISFSGSAPSRAFLRRFTGYVEQFDTLLGTLTVREMLLYTAEMKRSIKEPYAEKAEAVDAAIEKLGLEVCKNVVIGGKEHKGISGGQAKRVNIGLALISSPRVLFLDEPTTGLDSFTANEVMTTVKAIAEDNVTICATIHSPTQYAFSLFDNLLMLSRGQVVYFGSCRGAVPFAKASWGTFVAEDRADAANEAEWLTDLITATDRDGQTDALASAFASAPQCAALDADVEKYLASSREDLPQQIQDELATRSETSTPWWWGLKTMVKYRAPRNYRDPDWIGSRLGDKVIMSLLMWTLYFGVGRSNGPENLINVPNLLFMWCILPAYGAAGYLPSLVMERALYVRERSDGLYLVITYLLAKMVEELTIALVTSVWVSAAAFYAMGLQGSFLLFWLVYVVVLMIGVVLGYFVACISPTMDIANTILPVYVTALLFFAGNLMNFETMPQYWIWFSYLDFIRYAWGALMINQYHKTDPVFFGSPTCDTDHSQPCVHILEHYQLANWPGIKYEIASGSVTQFSWYTQTMKRYDNIGFMSIFFFAYFFLAWIALAFGKFTKR